MIMLPAAADVESS